MKKCAECNGIMQEFKAKKPKEIEYNYHKCKKCGEEIIDMKQLHDVAEQYRVLKNIIKMKSLELIEKIKRSEEQIKKGKFVKVDNSMSGEEIDDLLVA